MLTFRNLFISIAGLWILCTIQNQTRPHQYIHYSSDEQTFHTVKTALDHSLNVKAPKSAYAPHDTPIIGPVLPLVPVIQKFYSPIARSKSRLKLYRLFPTGLSPPDFSV